MHMSGLERNGTTNRERGVNHVCPETAVSSTRRLRATCCVCQKPLTSQEQGSNRWIQPGIERILGFPMVLETLKWGHRLSHAFIGSTIY